MIGTLFNDRYRLEAELGRGGMGVVYRAHDTLLERDVAVKVWSAAQLGTEGRSQLLCEARAAAQLNHPSVVSVYDAGEAQGAPFIVMELVDGQPLPVGQVGHLPEVLSISGQVCAALEHAHAHGIVHRDLKPENILLAPGGTVKLGDFGLARSVASRLTGEGTILGTVFYLAPELALGQDFDGRADLYALGVMLYELTTGRLPFEADDPLAVISQHLYAPVVPPRARNEEIPAALDALIVQLLSKDPQDRPASAAGVQEVLERLAAGGEEPAVAHPVSGELSMLDRIVRGRLVARVEELAQARTLWRRATASEGQVLLVSGEPGIGKTRLIRELMTQVQVTGNQALLGECYTEAGTPYAPFAQMVRRSFQDGLLGDGAEKGLDLPDFVLADLLALVPGLKPRFSAVPPNPVLDPQSEQQRLFENLVTWCAALSDRSPLLLVLEDAHWADSSSLSLFRHLARRTRRQRVMLVTTYREVELDSMGPLQEVLVDLNRERLATRLKLARLDRSGTRDLLAALFAEEITPEFLEGIYRETEGNPFFIEEVCKALVESGQVTFVDGYWDRPGMEEMVIPQSLRVAIESRVGKLPPDCQQTLRLAAILGREFEFDTLREASELEEDALIQALECARRSQLIEEVRAQREVTFAFTHGLIPAALVEGVGTLWRRRLHRRLAAAIERLYPDDAYFQALAYHYGEAGDEERALIYHRKAGEHSSAAYANTEAEYHFRAALALVGTEAERAGLLDELARVLARQSRNEEAIETWQEAIALYQSLDNQDAIALSYALAARAAWYGGDTRRCLALCREGMAAVALAPDGPEVVPSRGSAELLHETARACHFNGLAEEAALLCHQVLEMAERLGMVKVQAEALTTLGILPGQPSEDAISALTSAVELAEGAGLLRQASRALNNLGIQLASRCGEIQAAREHLLRAAELDRQRGAVHEQVFAATNASLMALFQGAFQVVEQELSWQRQLLDTIPNPEAAAIGLRITEALLLRARGNLEVALARFRTLQEEARTSGDLQMLHRIKESLADLLLEIGEDDGAEAALQEALALCEQGVTTSTGALARCLLSMVRSHQGALSEARRLIADARQRAADLSADAWEAIWVLPAEAHLALAEGRWKDALAKVEAAAQAFARAGLRWHQARTLREWAGIHLARGDPGDHERARDLLVQAEAEFEAMGVHAYAAPIRKQLESMAAEA
jgi:predicted ATPase/predicted Ser/Thr protein kinase